jgi:hypothetical protein
MESLTKDQLAYIERHGSTKNPKTIARDLKLELRHVQTALKNLRDPKANAARALLDPAPLIAPKSPSRAPSLVLVVAAALAILVLGAIAYSNNASCGWHFDDAHTITGNDAIHNPTLGGIYRNNIYRQVLYWSFAFSWWRNGKTGPQGEIVAQDIGGWHVENNAIHLLNGLLVFWLALLTLRSPGGRSQSRWPVLTAGLAGAIFVLHPLQTQAVTYITQRTESLCTTFYLLALGLYAWSRLRRADGRAVASVEGPALGLAAAVALVVLAAARFGSPSGPQLKPFLAVTAVAGLGAIGSIVFLIVTRRADPIESLLLLGSLAFTSVAMETKEIAGTIPAAMILWEILFGTPRCGQGTKPPLVERLRSHAAVAPYAAMLVFLPVLAVAMNLSPRLFFKEGVEAVSDIRDTTGMQYVLTEINVLSTYVRLYLLPYGQALDYDYPIRSTLMDGPTLFSLGALGVALWAAIRGFRRWPVITWSVLLGLGVLAPTSLFVLPDVIFEHRVYLPLAGAALLTALLLERVVRRLVKDEALGMRVFVGASIPILLVLLVLTRGRNEVWIDDPTLWADSAAKSPKKARPLTNIGIAYGNLEPWKFVLKNGQVIGGDFIDGDKIPSGPKGYYLILPTFASMIPNLQRKVLVPKSEVVDGPKPWGGQLAAEREYEQALELDPDYYKARNNLALCEVQIGTLRLERAQDMRVTIEEVKKTHPADDPQLVRGEERLKEVELEALAHFKKAEASFKRILERHPKDYVALNNLGNLYFQYMDRTDDAIACIEASIQLDQSQAIIFAVAGEAYYERANENADKEKRLEAVADYKKAVDYYQKFLELSAGNPNFEHIRVRLQKAQAGVQTGTRVAPLATEPAAPGNPFQPAAGNNVGNMPRWKPPVVKP